MLAAALKHFTTLQRQRMRAEATYCLSCAEVLLTLQMNKVHERLRAVRDNRNIFGVSKRDNAGLSALPSEGGWILQL